MKAILWTVSPAHRGQKSGQCRSNAGKDKERFESEIEKTFHN
jgi:hypothetical protein